MKRIIRLCVVGILLVVFVSCSVTRSVQEQPFAQTKAIAQEIGDTLVTGPGGVSALSIAIMHEGRLIYSEGFGKRDIASNLPVDAHTRFNIGSISKVFTAASILMIEEDGLLALDDRVADLLPSFTMQDERYKDITVRMLLSHTSGMPGTNMRDAFSSQSSIEYLQQSMEEFAKSTLKHDPGAFSPYCNDGFTVAQALVEHLTGLSFSQFLEQRIFHPLGMADTSVGFYEHDENMAYGYMDRTTPLPKEYVNVVASGGITSTAEDLLRYSTMLYSQNLLSKASLTEYFTDQKPDYVQDSNLDRLLSYGLGWDFTFWEPYRTQGIQVLGKTGGTLEFSTMIFILPQTQSAVVLLSCGHIDPIGTTLPIVDALLKETKQIPSKTKSKEVESKTEKTLPPDIETYSGYYGSGTGLFRLSFNQKDSALVFESYDGSAFAETNTARHIGAGIFEDPQGTWYAFEKLLGVQSLMVLRRPYHLSQIAMTRLDGQAPAIRHEFTESTWLPANFPLHDLFLPVYSISLIEELPSHLILDEVAYAITDSRQTSMALPALRDQSPPRLDEDGHLIVGPYICANTSEIQALAPGKPIAAGDATSTVWRRITEQGTFSCTIPEGGRIIVLGPDLENLEDTLFSGLGHIEMDIFGSYVAFIAEEPRVFEPDITF